jgi:hypothetical protein
MEYWINGLMERENGVVEHWSIGVMGNSKELSYQYNASVLQHSKTPLLHVFSIPEVF